LARGEVEEEARKEGIKLIVKEGIPFYLSLVPSVQEKVVGYSKERGAGEAFVNVSQVQLGTPRTRPFLVVSPVLARPNYRRGGHVNIY